MSRKKKYNSEKRTWRGRSYKKGGRYKANRIQDIHVKSAEKADQNETNKN